MNKKIQSTIWLDLLTYIILPLVILVSTINIFTTIFHITWQVYTIVLMLVEISLTIFYAVTVYHTHKRTSLAPKLLRALFWVTAIQTSFEYANTQQINKGYNIFIAFAIYFAICYVVWIRTNETYLENRMDIFGKESSLKKNYRCPECKRLVPIGKDCPNCTKKESKPKKDAVKEKENKIDKKSTKKES